LKRALPWLLLIFIIISFATLPRNPLLTDDAALYALAAKNAIIHNQWLAQYVTPGDLSSFLDKPPLGVWMLAWLPKLFGINELTINVPNVIYYVFLLAILYWWLSRTASKELAFNSTLIASTSLALVVYSRAPKLDVLLALFILTAHLSLFSFIKKNNPSYLYFFTLSLALGFLVKSGFGLIMTAFLLLALFICIAEAREKLLKALFSWHSIINLLLLIAVIGGVLYSQSFSLKEQWIPYLKSITVQSKYNVSYLGLVFNYSIIGMLLITLFPWMPLFFKGLKLKLAEKEMTLSNFCSIWFWSNFFFFLFFFRQTDFRTFTVLVPPMAVLAGSKLTEPATERRGSMSNILWSLFYLFVFSLLLISLLIKPVNPQGFSLINAIVPIAFFVVALVSLTVYFWKPSSAKLAVSFFLICLSYSVLFWNTKPIADAFNEDLKWLGIIKEYRAKGFQFYIYRPPDRQLFYSPDLFWVDFMAGPADKYVWNGKELVNELKSQKGIILSDTKSWEKLKYRRAKIIAQDSYSSLILR
jgi:4-amino-4-deoxy-L-arabinose transferase-like glycosyltransferase